ncbi:MAG: hypothetical protein LBS92_03610 [Candidatus Methanoplasma sp.]|jgi:hypothetical protein|nr:hypothetical protein [Candidatus Methanoplasma sp.]
MTNEELAYPFRGDLADSRAVDELVKGRIGSMCYVSSMPDDKEGFIGIGLYTDEVVMDSVDSVPRVHFLKHDNVFRAYFREGSIGNTVVFPPIAEIDVRIAAYLDGNRDRSEVSLLKSIGAGIVNIPQVRNQMNPIFEIVNFLLRSNTAVRKSSFKWKEEKLNRYLDFLQAIDVVGIDGAEILPGEAMHSKMDCDMSSTEVCERVVAQMVENSAKYMVTKLNISQLQPYVRLSNANCMTSAIEDSPLKWNADKYGFYLKRIYGVRDGAVRVTSTAATLSHVGIFSEEKHSNGTVYYCNEDVFGKYRNTLRCSA